MHRFIAWVIAAWTLLAGATALARTREEVRAVIAPDGHPVRLITRFGDTSHAEVRVGDGETKRLHDAAAVGTVTTGHGKVVVALAVDDVKRPFRVHLLDAGGNPGKATVIERPTRRRDIAFAVVATPTPTGFALFFQEIQADDPSSAHTYLVKLDTGGAIAGAAKEIAVPWALGDAIWNGHGYHLALLYSGGGDGMRLSMVSLDEAGAPRQHPDWASEAGYIHDVHLVTEGERILAFYAGGPRGDRLRRRDVTTVGAWGGSPSASKDLGRLPAGKAIAIDAKGQPIHVSR